MKLFLNGNGYHRQADKEETSKEELRQLSPKRLTGNPQILENMKMDMEHLYLSKRCFLYEYYYIEKCAYFKSSR